MIWNQVSHVHTGNLSATHEILTWHVKPGGKAVVGAVLRRVDAGEAVQVLDVHILSAATNTAAAARQLSATLLLGLKF